MSWLEAVIYALATIGAIATLAFLALCVLDVFDRCVRNETDRQVEAYKREQQAVWMGEVE